MIGLRTKWGVKYNIINQFSEKILKPFQKSLETKLSLGTLKLEENQILYQKNIGLWQMALFLICLLSDLSIFVHI